jgi:hypothetical protein
MAAKWYRSLVEPTGDPRGEILIGGAHPGEVFQFDYDRPGYNAEVLLETGGIEEIAEPTKEQLAAVAKRKGHADVQKHTKEELVKLLEDSWEA